MDLFDFVRLSENNKNLQEEISNCENYKKLEKILAKYQCEFKIEEMEKVSQDLAASYWPWSQQTRLERKEFFIRP